MIKSVSAWIAIFATGLLPAAAAANVIAPSDDYRIVRVEFSGTVTSSITDDIVIRSSDGSVRPYTGPIPDYPFDTGDPITIGFDAIVPTGEAIQAGLVPPSADGIYTFQIGPRPEDLDRFPGTASFGNFSGNGGIADTGNYGTDGNLSIVYDANTDSYLINPLPEGSFGLGNDTFGIGFFDFPYLAYDTSNDTLFTASLLDLFPTNAGAAWSGLGEDSGRIPTTIYNFNGSEFLGARPVGAFADGNVRFSGSWNLPVFGRTSTPVPAPGIAVIFGLVCGALMLRRRRRRKAL